MSDFTTGVEGIDAATLEREMEEAFAARFEGWGPAEGSPMRWATKNFARIGAMLFGQLGLTLTAMFKRYGESLIAEPPIKAAPAVAETTWTAVEASSVERTIPAGTQVKVPGPDEKPRGFRTIADVVVPAEATSAAVTMVAIEPGVAGNNLSGEAVLSDSLVWIDTVTLDAPTSNGVDEEEEDAYLNRLVETVQLRSSSLIVGKDFEIDARGMAPVARALCIEAYDADEGKAKALHVSIYSRDLNGDPLSGPNQAALVARQQAKVPSGVTVHGGDATYTPVNVKTEFAVRAGFDPTATEAAVEERLAAYLAKANWGAPEAGDPGSSAGWENRTEVYVNELIAEVDRVGGVDRVVSLELSADEDPLGTEDLTLPGKVAIAEPGTLEASVA